MALLSCQCGKTARVVEREISRFGTAYQHYPALMPDMLPIRVILVKCCHCKYKSKQVITKAGLTLVDQENAQVRVH